MTQLFRDEKRVRYYARDVPPGEELPCCVYCGLTVYPGRMPSDSAGGQVAATLDHVEPGRGNEPWNVLTACAGCNIDKAERSPEEWEAAGGGQWKSERPLPVGGRTLAGRVMLSLSRPLCGESDSMCSALVGRIAAERRRAIGKKKPAKVRR